VTKRNKKNNKPQPKKAANPHVVQIRRGSHTDWPDLWAEVFIAADNTVEERLIAEMMMIGGKCRKAESVETADIVIFGGGADVQPHLYGELPHSSTRCDPARDKADRELWKYCYENGVPMMGICRGAQFGHVMMGGKLYQDVDNHNSEHGMWLVEENRIIPSISSVHHQMVRPNDGMTLLGTIHGRSTRRYTTPTVMANGKNDDIEAFFYRDACFFGVQGHPEYRRYTQYRYWVLETMKQLLVENPDLVLTSDRVRRLKKDILENRPKIKELKTEKS
tara:strand:+ start:30650 stop:31480 length:831 start_codon:yes stop_codon:yes gene_type:complete